MVASVGGWPACSRARRGEVAGWAWPRVPHRQPGAPRSPADPSPAEGLRRCASVAPAGAVLSASFARGGLPHPDGGFARRARCAPGRIRTCDLVIRRDVLYPAELRGLSSARIVLNRTVRLGCHALRMAAHHTKDKGDLGLAKAHADLVGQGLMVLFPATEHAAFDLVAYARGQFHRVQVKYRAAQAGGVSVQFRSTWSDRDGTHIRPMDKDEVDVVCVYCPDTDHCYYLRPADHGASVRLRVMPSRNGQVAGILRAADHRIFPAGPRVGTGSQVSRSPTLTA